MSGVEFHLPGVCGCIRTHSQLRLIQPNNTQNFCMNWQTERCIWHGLSMGSVLAIEISHAKIFFRIRRGYKFSEVLCVCPEKKSEYGETMN